MAIKGAGGKMRAQDGTPFSAGTPNPDGGHIVMQAFPQRTDRRHGRPEAINIRDERGMSSGSRERNSTIAGT